MVFVPSSSCWVITCDREVDWVHRLALLAKPRIIIVTIPGGVVDVRRGQKGDEKVVIILGDFIVPSPGGLHQGTQTKKLLPLVETEKYNGQGQTKSRLWVVVKVGVSELAKSTN